MNNLKSKNYENEMHAWFNGHRTIVHGHLKHCSLAIEQLFVEA